MAGKKHNISYEEIKHRQSLIAIIVRADYKCERTTFFSPHSFSQQLGLIVYKKGGVIKAHFHKKVRKKITLTQEVLFIKKGRLITVVSGTSAFDKVASPYGRVIILHEKLNSLPNNPPFHYSIIIPRLPLAFGQERVAVQFGKLIQNLFAFHQRSP